MWAMIQLRNRPFTASSLTPILAVIANSLLLLINVRSLPKQLIREIHTFSKEVVNYGLLATKSDHCLQKYLPSI
jgi:hypothetical protein